MGQTEETTRTMKTKKTIAESNFKMQVLIRLIGFAALLNVLCDATGNNLNKLQTEVFQADSGADIIEQLAAFLNATRSEIQQLKTDRNADRSQIHQLKTDVNNLKAGQLTCQSSTDYVKPPKTWTFSPSFSGKPNIIVAMRSYDGVPVGILEYSLTSTTLKIGMTHQAANRNIIAAWMACGVKA